MTQSKDFSARLDFAMKKRNMRQADLARGMGTAYSTVSRWLENSMPRERTLRELADLLCVSQKWLAEGIGEIEASNDTAMICEDPAKYGAVKPIIQPFEEALKKVSANDALEAAMQLTQMMVGANKYVRVHFYEKLRALIDAAEKKDNEPFEQKEP